jgi:hypothetical protein
VTEVKAKVNVKVDVKVKIKVDGQGENWGAYLAAFGRPSGADAGLLG